MQQNASDAAPTVFLVDLKSFWLGKGGNFWELIWL